MNILKSIIYGVGAVLWSLKNYDLHSRIRSYLHIKKIVWGFDSPAPLQKSLKSNKINVSFYDLIKGSCF